MTKVFNKGDERQQHVVVSEMALPLVVEKGLLEVWTTAKTRRVYFKEEVSHLELAEG